MKTKAKELVSRTIGLFFILLLLTNCTDENSRTINEDFQNRIKLKETRVINGYRYSIIQVDSVEYLTMDKGGFVQLPK